MSRKISMFFKFFFGIRRAAVLLCVIMQDARYARRCWKYMIFCKNIEKIMTNVILCVIIIVEGSITARRAVIERTPVMLFAGMTPRGGYTA